MSWLVCMCAKYSACPSVASLCDNLESTAKRLWIGNDNTVTKIMNDPYGGYFEISYTIIELTLLVL